MTGFGSEDINRLGYGQKDKFNQAYDPYTKGMSNPTQPSYVPSDPNTEGEKKKKKKKKVVVESSSSDSDSSDSDSEEKEKKRKKEKRKAKALAEEQKSK